MHQRINVAPGSLNAKGFGDVQRPDLVRFCGERQQRSRSGTDSEHLPAFGRKQIGCGLTKEAAAYDNDPGQKA